MRTLTEDEIRRRLYGAYQVEQPDSEIKSVKPTVQDLASPRTLATKEKEIPPAKIRDDLFEAERTSAQNTPQEKRPFSIPEEISEQERMVRLAEIAEKEKRRPPPYLTRRDPWQKPPVEKKQQEQSKILLTVALSALSGLGVALKLLMSVVVFVLSYLVKLIGKVDLRRPEAKRALYWVAGAVVLAALFLSVHSLNVRREAAMNTPVLEAERSSALSAGRENRVISRSTPPASAERKSSTSTNRAKSEAIEPVSSPKERREDKKEERRAERNKNEEAPKKSLPPPPVSEGRYVIQIATYASSDDANRIVEQLTKEGASVFVRALSRPSGKVYYALFLGRFESFQDAQLKLEKFRKKDTAAPFEDAFIRTLES